MFLSYFTIGPSGNVSCIYKINETNEVAEEVLGRPINIKQPFVPEKTLTLCDKRRELKKDSVCLCNESGRQLIGKEQSAPMT